MATESRGWLTLFEPASFRGARLQIIERAGHNAHAEQPAEVMAAVRDFIAA